MVGRQWVGYFKNNMENSSPTLPKRHINPWPTPALTTKPKLLITEEGWNVSEWNYELWSCQFVPVLQVLEAQRTCQKWPCPHNQAFNVKSDLGGFLSFSHRFAAVWEECFDQCECAAARLQSSSWAGANVRGNIWISSSSHHFWLLSGHWCQINEQILSVLSGYSIP